MDIDCLPPSVETLSEDVVNKSSTKLKKKKKKASYKSMMAGMMQSTGSDTEKHSDKIRSVTGGGAFAKIEKI